MRTARPRAPAALNKSSFSDWRKKLSYSFTNMYPDAGAVDQGYKLNTTVGAETAIVADMNPGVGGGFRRHRTDRGLFTGLECRRLTAAIIKGQGQKCALWRWPRRVPAEPILRFQA